MTIYFRPIVPVPSAWARFRVFSAGQSWDGISQSSISLFSSSVGWVIFISYYFKGLAYFLTVSLLNVNALAFLIPVPTESGSTEKPSLHIFKMRLWGYLTIFSGIKCILVWVYASVPSTNFLTLSQMYRQAVVKTWQVCYANIAYLSGLLQQHCHSYY
jgi:hypothetical protein